MDNQPGIKPAPKPEKSGADRINRRHIVGFRKFQRAALKALALAVNALDGSDDAEKKTDKAVVKVADMKSLVSAYKDAVTGERMVLGMSGGGVTDAWPEEMVVRWVDDETDAGGEQFDIP